MSKLKVKKNSHLFKCPICGSKMELIDLKSLICEKKHCYDLAKSGYVNFLAHPVKTEYDKAMLKARNLICQSGFFKPLVERISELILQTCKEENERNFILDVGCGEGSHLAQVIELLNEKTSSGFEGVGIDISKDGIQIAAREYPTCLWCVGDLVNTPFQTESFAVLLNILSPSNYAEFKRLLKPNGLLIKVVPGSLYLQELRESFYNQTEKHTYSNAKVVQLFRESFSFLGQEELKYEVNLTTTDLEHLIKMTPLSWKVPEERKTKLLTVGLDKITVDLTILFGKAANF